MRVSLIDVHRPVYLLTYTDRFTFGKRRPKLDLVTTATRTRKPGARDRLIVAAERLFYAEGIRAVGVDRLCAEAEVSKRSLYQHFSGKDEVVTAMLQAKAAELGQPAGDRRPVAAGAHPHRVRAGRRGRRGA